MASQERLKKYISWYAFLIMFYHLIYASGVLNIWNIDLGGIHGAVSVGLLLSLLFITVPASKKQGDNKSIKWYDWVLALAAVIPSIYFAMNFERSLYSSLTPNNIEVALGVTFILVVFEAARRSVGWPIAAIGVIFLLYPKLAPHLPGILFASKVSWPRLIGEVYLGTQGIFSSIATTFATVVAIFIIFGQLFDVSRGGGSLLDLALSILGDKRGGPAKAAAFGSAIFGSMSGIAVANVMTTGSITIPLMKRTGFDKEYAGAVEAVASTGGAIMPPVMGILAFVMADFLQVPYWSIAIAALIPACLYYLSIYLQIDLEAAKLGLVGLPKTDLPKLKDSFNKSWPYLIPLAVMLYLFVAKGWSAMRVGFYAVITIYLIHVLKVLSDKERANSRDIASGAFVALSNAGKMLSGIIPAAGVAGIIMSSVNLTALGLRLSSGLVSIAGGNLLLLLILSALTCYLMGTAIDLIVIYLVLAVLVAPALIQMGVLPIAAHLFILYYTVVGLITPPVCMSVYASCAISGGNVFKTGFQAMKLGFVALVVPFFFVYRPTLLLQGAPHLIVIDSLSAIIGVIAMAIFLEGYVFNRPTRLVQRLLFGLGGFLSMYPKIIPTLIGLGLIALGFVSYFLFKGDIEDKPFYRG